MKRVRPCSMLSLALVALLAAAVVDAQTCGHVTVSTPQVLFATDAAQKSFMGQYVGVADGSPDYIVAGAYGVDAYRGAAYVFRGVNSRFAQSQAFVATDLNPGAYTGLNVAISGTRMIVGSPFSSTNGVTCGSAQIFELRGGSWVKTRKLVPFDCADNQYFGYSVTANGGRIAVGARVANTPQGGSRLGAVYVYNAGANGAYPLLQTLRGKVTAAFFGDEVRLTSTYLMVGAPNDLDTQGAAYLFELAAKGRFALRQKFTHSKLPGVTVKNGDHFGEGIGISADGSLVVGGGEMAGSPAGSTSGAAFLFRRNGGAGSQYSYVQPLYPSVKGGQRYAQRLDVRNDIIVVSAWSAGAGPSAAHAGVAYVYTKCSNNHFSEQTRLTAPAARADDEFGKIIKISSKYIVVGASQRDKGSDLSSNEGAVYVFKYTL